MKKIVNYDEIQHLKLNDPIVFRYIIYFLKINRTFLGNPGLSSLIVLANAQNILMIIFYKKHSTIDYLTELVIGNVKKQLQRKNTHKKAFDDHTLDDTDTAGESSNMIRKEITTF